MNWKIKLGIAGLVVLLLVFIAPSVFGEIFGAIKDTTMACDKAARDVELPKVDTYK